MSRPNTWSFAFNPFRPATAAAAAINDILFKYRQYYSASYFEGVDRQYNEASAATAAEYVSRENILATLVFACSHKAARTAFPQAECIGAKVTEAEMKTPPLAQIFLTRIVVRGDWYT